MLKPVLLLALSAPFAVPPKAVPSDQEKVLQAKLAEVQARKAELQAKYTEVQSQMRAAVADERRLQTELDDARAKAAPGVIKAEVRGVLLDKMWAIRVRPSDGQSYPDGGMIILRGGTDDHDRQVRELSGKEVIAKGRLEYEALNPMAHVTRHAWVLHLTEIAEAPKK